MFKILIAEDDYELRHLFSHVLIKNGYFVKEVDNGKEALEAIEKDFVRIGVRAFYCIKDVKEEVGN